MSDVKTYYDILEVSADASYEEIKKSYRRLSLQYHPDRNKGVAYFEERFKEINAAYQVLKDPETRNRYDTNLYYASQPHHDAYAEQRAQQAAYEYEQQQQWMAEQIRAQVKANDRRFFRSVAAAVMVMCVLLMITRFARKKQDPYLPLILNEELAKKLKQYEDGGQKDSALLSEVILELRKRSADPALHAGLYANDSCLVSGTIQVDTLAGSTKEDFDGTAKVTKPIYILQLPKSIYLLDKDDPAYETSNLVSSIHILDPEINSNLYQHINKPVTISCVLQKRKTDNDEYAAFTKDVYKMEVIE